MNKILFKAGSDTNFVLSLLTRAGWVALIFYLTTVYNENPVVVGIAILIVLFCLYHTGNDELIVYEDRLVQQETSIAGLLFPSNKRTFQLSELRSASLPAEKRPGPGDAAVLVILSALMPVRSSATMRNRLLVELKDGKTITLSSGITQKKLQKVADTLNTALMHKQ